MDTEKLKQEMVKYRAECVRLKRRTERLYKAYEESLKHYKKAKAAFERTDRKLAEQDGRLNILPSKEEMKRSNLASLQESEEVKMIRRMNPGEFSEFIKKLEAEV